MGFEQLVGRSEIDQELVPVGHYLLDRQGDGAERVERLEGLPEVLSGEVAVHLEGRGDVGVAEQHGDRLDVGSSLDGPRGVVVPEGMRGAA